jgi:hypothetical protein
MSDPDETALDHGRNNGAQDARRDVERPRATEIRLRHDSLRHGPLMLSRLEHAVPARLLGRLFYEARAAEWPCAEDEQQPIYNNEYEEPRQSRQEMRQRIRYALEEQSVDNSEGE